MSFLMLILIAGATWRLARLVTVDEITRRPRDWIASRGDTWAYFITCPWCVSIWVGIAVAGTIVAFEDNRGVWALYGALTASIVAGIGQAIEDRLDR